ncbi:transport and Golgi organization protein 2 isoform X2 [Vanessa tameamea]|uniref:Transport and Golgi organization protein 2 isoform X2 n=1 Tax=Vanessa tameamea TaxID=334116 RepID=A0ABM4ASW6_VANTA
MCILFVYNGANDIESDFSLILISNRDENYSRPAQCMAPWSEDPCVYGGRDLETGCEKGTWLAISSKYKKIGLLLNLPGVKKENAKSRGTVVADYVKSNLKLLDYIESIKNYTNNCNEFIFVSVELGNLPDLQLEERRPNIYEELSSIFVNIPKARYGTRAHTIVLVTKSGQVDLVELSLKSPINIENPEWERNEFQFII